MKEGKPSFTAEGAAAIRGAESMRPEGRRVCYDPFAKEFVGRLYRTIGSSRLLVWLTVRFAELVVPGMVGYVVGRTRCIDDYLSSRIDDGIRQLVILGAGYDSRAYRFETLKEGVKVFEVDFPSTQKVKMHKVKKALGSLPDHVVYVAVDFNRQKLGERLFECGYDRNLKTLFIWEGVTAYLTPEALDDTLSFVVKNSGEGSSIVFDFFIKAAVDGTTGIGVVNRIRRLYGLVGQPLTSERVILGLEQGAIEAFMQERGFCQVKNVTGGSFTSSYLKGTNQNGRMLCIVSATVAPRARMS